MHVGIFQNLNVKQYVKQELKKYSKSKAQENRGTNKLKNIV